MKIWIAALALMPAAAFAGSAFDGTWKSRVDSFKQTGKPDVFAVADGTYTCSSCTPEIKIKADGTDQQVTGHDYYDSEAVKVVDASTIERTTKLAGKVMNRSTLSASKDGKTLNGKFTDYSGAKPATASYVETRVAAGPAGSHATSGSWRLEKATNANDALTTVSYTMTGDHFTMNSNGQSYDAKFDGKEYPVNGDPGHTMVKLKRIDDRTVMETDSRSGKTTDEVRLAVAEDGKTVKVTDKDVRNGQTTTYTLDKQK
ncbi:MAG: hypothetical protein JOZ89_03475 [Gammaproteobacteria bacterium]|nr:hypothetical protein [Gammaproteobacteria bacterium]